MAPSTAGCSQMKWMPPNTERSVGASRGGTGRSRRMENTSVLATRNSTVANANGIEPPSAYSKPPKAGPRMVAVWLAEADQALACCSRASPTSPGISADSVGDSKARAAPTSATMPNTPATGSRPLAVPTASDALATASRTWQQPTMRRRS